MGNEVFFEVWDKDRLSKDDLMGKVAIWMILQLKQLCRPRSSSTLSCSLWQTLVPSFVFLSPRNSQEMAIFMARKLN